MTRYVFGSTQSKKNWIFLYKRKGMLYFNVLNKQIGMMEAVYPIYMFTYERTIDRNDDNVIIKDEVREVL